MHDKMFRRVIPVCLVVVTVALLSTGEIIAPAAGKGNAGNTSVAAKGGTQPFAFEEHWGDVDRNGKIDSTDARLTLQFAVGKIKESALHTAAADVDGDNTVNSTDARLILQYAVKKIKRLPATKCVYEYAVEKGLTVATNEEEWLNSLQKPATTIVGAYVDTENCLILKLSDGTKVNAGRVSDATEGGTSTTPVVTTPSSTTVIKTTTGQTTTTTAPSTEGSTTTTAPTAVERHNVIFKDHDGTVLKSIEVEHGKAAIAPDVPNRSGYIFIGWDTEFDCVTDDLVVTADYREIDEPTLLLPNIVASAGETVEIPVTVCKNPGIAGARIVVTYDKALSLVGATEGTAFERLDYTAPATFASPCPFNWDSLDATSAANGTVVLLKFSVSADAATGDTFNVELSYRKGDIYNAALDDVDLALINGTITVR